MIKDRTWLVVAAFILAPFGTAIVMAAGTRISSNFDFLASLGLTFVFYPFAVVPTLVIGGPIYFLLQRLGFMNLWTILSCGILIGLLGGLALYYPAIPDCHDLLNTMEMGAVSAFIFWLVWRRQFSAS
jgi:hypothetical protein